MSECAILMCILINFENKKLGFIFDIFLFKLPIIIYLGLFLNATSYKWPPLLLTAKLVIFVAFPITFWNNSDGIAMISVRAFVNGPNVAIVYFTFKITFEKKVWWSQILRHCWPVNVTSFWHQNSNNYCRNWAVSFGV